MTRDGRFSQMVVIISSRRSAPDAAQRAAVRCRSGVHALPRHCNGSRLCGAARRTLRRVRDTSHFVVGDIGMIWPAGLSERSRNAFSPRVPVAIRNDAASRIATVSVAVTSTTGVFMVDRSRCGSSRLVAQNFRAGISKDPEK